MKHPGTHRVVETHVFGRNTGSRHKFQASIGRISRGDNQSTYCAQVQMVCNLCCILYYLVVSFFKGLWMKLSDRHICIQQGFEMHVYGL